MLILIGHPCTADVRALSCSLGSSLGKMLLSALRGRLWHLQMKQSQFHPERRDQCNAGDIRNLVFKMYFVLYSLSQCPNTLLSTAKLSFNLLSRDTNSNKTTIVPQNKPCLLPSVSQSDIFSGHGGSGVRGQPQGGVAQALPLHGQPAPSRWWHRGLCSFPATAPSHAPQSVPCQGSQKGQQSATASPRVSLGRCPCAPSLQQNEAGHNHSPAVAESRSVIMSPNPPEGPTVS